MRGEHADERACWPTRHGIIPACAGSTTYNGEECSVVEGSSPHARGALYWYLWWLTSMGDHPRMRGEHGAEDSSSDQHQGIIPACAGSTNDKTPEDFRDLGSSPHARGARCPPWPLAGCRWDHPRMRGEHYDVVDLRLGVDGIIPACAGSTSICLAAVIALEGSSPHARGARLLTSTALLYFSDFTSILFSRFTITSPKSTTEPSCPMVLASVAPSAFWCGHQRGVLGALRPLDELNSLDVDRLPVGLVNLEGHMLLVISRVRHDGATAFNQELNPIPQPVSHLCRGVADEHARSNL